MVAVPQKTKEQAAERKANFEREIKFKEAEAERLRQLRESIAGFVNAHHGWLTSAPGQNPLRIEVRVGNDLIDKLIDAGLDVQPLGSHSRNQDGKIIPVLLYAVHLAPMVK